MSQQNFLKSTFHSIYVVFLIIFISSCAAPSKPQKAPKQVTTKPIETKTESTRYDLDYFLNQAEATVGDDSIDNLLLASNLLLTESDFKKALWLANHIQSIAEQPQHIYQSQLYQAQSLLALGQIELSSQQLKSASETVKAHNLNHQISFYQLSYQVHSLQNNQVLALAAKLQLLATKSEPSEADIVSTWKDISELTNWQLAQLVKLNPPAIKGWSQLSGYARRFGGSQAQLRRYLRQWQTQYPDHTGQIISQSILEAEPLLPPSADNIAVLLPLTGNQKQAGLAAQHGILAALSAIPEKQVTFYDANTLDWSTLSTKLSENETDFIIGPLLRNNVKSFLEIPDLTIPSLLLNVLPEIDLKAHQVALSMRPEDEAVQAATVLSQQNYQHPIILVHQDNVSLRIANTFASEWQRQTGKLPEVAYFEKGTSMQDSLKNSLELKQSQDRVDDLNIRIKQTIKTDIRNRRDIDMIYIVGSPVQTKLLKPYIDVSISPFANVIPVYASSRSHSLRIDPRDARDLNGLTFTEMPWLLASKQQNKALAKKAQQLFPKRSDSLQRIFAMGYDAFNVTDTLYLMKAQPYVRHYGQTGILRLNDNNILTRSILWGRYQKTRVQEIVMDR